jgi:Predicted metal-binding protein related to the C-terminal domain of SecA
MGKIGRNQPCPCGSGKKFKRCHGAFEVSPSQSPLLPPSKSLQDTLRQAEARQKLLERQQGRGRGIVSGKLGDKRFVAVGNNIFHSERWLTFCDFLSSYIKIKLGPEWGNGELRKNFADRHPIMQWYDAVARAQAEHPDAASKKAVKSSPITGAMVCYLGLAYNLYLLEHNVELQVRYLKRLKDVRNFQGAYYELIVAGVLLRAGFRLELENETDDSTKHCEFSAVSKTTGRKYWVEAKMRSVEGVLGKTRHDGAKPTDRDATRNLTAHLNGALGKPAADERLVFIDLNAEIPNGNGLPDWFDKAIIRLEAREKVLKAHETAYVFVTNLPFHRYLNETSVPRQVLAYGLGIADFSKPVPRTLREAYSLKRKHIDGHEIMDAIQEYPVFPDTFDGSLRSDSTGLNVKIGETYLFTDMGDAPGTVATVTTGVVDDTKGEALIGVTTSNGESFIMRQPLTPEQLEDYRRFPDLFFGEESGNGGGIDDPLKFFEWLLKTYSKTPKEKLLEFMSTGPNAAALALLPQAELAEIYCERLVLNFLSQHAPEKLRPPLSDG